MKTVMGWIDKIVSSLARRKVNKDEGRPADRRACPICPDPLRDSNVRRIVGCAGQNERHPVGRRRRSR